MSEPSASGSVEINATPAAVYAMVSNPAGMAAIAEETNKVLRRKGPAEVGRHFVGVNRQGWHVWPTVGRITDADPGRRYAFTVRDPFGIPVSRWQYDIEPTESGVKVTESTWDHRPKWYVSVTVPFTGVRDRASTNTANIAKTLASLKARLEG